MFLASPFLGTGLDTYKDIFPRFGPDGFTLFYAHNDLAQLLAEGGLACGALALAYLRIFASRFMEFIRTTSDDDRALNAGFWVGLMGIGTHSLFDWNLHSPANAFLTAVVAGLALSSAASTRRSQFLDRIPLSILTWNLFTIVMIAIGFLARDSISQNTVKQLRNIVVAGQPPSPIGAGLHTKANSSRLLTFAERWSRWDPRNASLLISIGQGVLYADAETSMISDRARDVTLADRYFQEALKATAIPQGMPEPRIETRR
jgi:hypothetical protein